MKRPTVRDVQAALLPEVEWTVKSFSDHRSLGFVSCDGIGGGGRFAATSLEVSSLNDRSLLSARSETLSKAWRSLLSRRSLLCQQQQQSPLPQLPLLSACAGCFRCPLLRLDPACRGAAGVPCGQRSVGVNVCHTSSRTSDSGMRPACPLSGPPDCTAAKDVAVTTSEMALPLSSKMPRQARRDPGQCWWRDSFSARDLLEPPPLVRHTAVSWGAYRCHLRVPSPFRSSTSPLLHRVRVWLRRRSQTCRVNSGLS